MAESGGADGIRPNKRSKTQEKEDRLSALPDSLIHHILSFLPSTKQAIRTGVLSKRWLNQWTLVPNLIFDFSGMSFNNSPKGISNSTSTISRIIDRTLLLHDCSKIQKFQIVSKKQYKFSQDPNCDVKLRFVIRKQVKELVLDFCIEQKFKLPDFFFRQEFLVKLELYDCSIEPIGMVYWPSLRDLLLVGCHYDDRAVESILSGCPLLRSLEMHWRYRINPLVISSESLKRLFFVEINCNFDVLCPNLVEFGVVASPNSLGDKVFEKILSDCPLLESLTFMNYECVNIRISSNRLKKLAFNDVKFREIEISCPLLEQLELFDLDAESIRLTNLPSSVSAALDFNAYGDGSKENVAEQILEQLQHVRDLKLGSSFVGVLSDRLMAGLSCPVLNGKALSLKGAVELVPGIVCALCSSPVLERLVVMLQPVKSQKLTGLLDNDYLEENYWHNTHFSGLVSHLKNVEITGFSGREKSPKVVLDFVEFLLENAILLEKVSIRLGDCKTDFAVEVSQKLLFFQRRSNAILEVLCSKKN